MKILQIQYFVGLAVWLCTSIVCLGQSDPDTFTVSELYSGRILFQFASDQTPYPLPAGVSDFTIGKVQNDKWATSTLILLRPGKKINFETSDSGISSSYLADSILNFLSHNLNQFLAEHTQLIFSDPKIDSLVHLTEKLRLNNREAILQKNNIIPPEELDILLFQNDAQIYSLRFFFGRIVRNIDPEDSYYQFAQRIDNDTDYAMSMPHNTLYKLELEYLCTYDSIVSIHSFLEFIKTQIQSRKLHNYFSAIYLSEIIKNPVYWKHHQKLLNTVTIKNVIEEEQFNPYSYYIEDAVSSYFASQNGEPAFNFSAETPDGSTVELKDYLGSVVFVAVWDTQCDPSKVQRQSVINLEKKYSEIDQIQVLKVSIDRSKNAWLKFLDQRNELQQRGELIIRDGIDSEFAQKFNIRFLPKYLLIGKGGDIINANLGSPSPEIELMIEAEFEK